MCNCHKVVYEVFLQSNRKSEIKQKLYKLGLLNIAAADLHALFTLIQPPPKGDGEFLKAVLYADPFRGLLEVAGGDVMASQLLLHLSEVDIVCLVHIRAISRML